MATVKTCTTRACALTGLGMVAAAASLLSSSVTIGCRHFGNACKHDEYRQDRYCRDACAIDLYRLCWRAQMKRKTPDPSDRGQGRNTLHKLIRAANRDGKDDDSMQRVASVARRRTGSRGRDTRTQSVMREP